MQSARSSWTGGEAHLLGIRHTITIPIHNERRFLRLIRHVHGPSQVIVVDQLSNMHQRHPELRGSRDLRELRRTEPRCCCPFVVQADQLIPCQCPFPAHILPDAVTYSETGARLNTWTQVESSAEFVGSVNFLLNGVPCVNDGEVSLLLDNAP